MIDFIQLKCPKGQLRRPTWEHGRHHKFAFSKTILFALYGKKPSSLTVEPNSAAIGLSTAAVTCIKPDIEQILSKNRKLKIVIIPHQPTNEIIDQFLAYLQDYSADILSKGYEDKNRILIVDKIGVLADIYKTAHIAYVGGSFKQGIHNVMEPAIYGIPVLYGPVHKNAFEAEQLLRHKGAISVNNKTDFSESILKLLENKTFREETGNNAADFAIKNTGATKRIMKYINESLTTV